MKRGEEEHELSAKEILYEYVLRNKYIWILAAAYFFVYVVRTGVNDWTALFLKESKGYSQLGANGVISLFEIGGLFGCLCAGWASDLFFKAKRGPVNVFFAVGIILSILAFWYIPVGYPFLDSCAVFMLGFMIFGPQMLIGVHAAELSHKKAAASATGFIGWTAYMGAAVAGYPLGKVTQDWGWEGFFWFLFLCGIASVLLLFPLWGIRDRQHMEDAALAKAEAAT
jgi:OPA family sugar phosphate sensor protein UhpC-like MFS transporter